MYDLYYSFYSNAQIAVYMALLCLPCVCFISVFRRKTFTLVLYFECKQNEILRNVRASNYKKKGKKLPVRYGRNHAAFFPGDMFLISQLSISTHAKEWKKTIRASQINKVDNKPSCFCFFINVETGLVTLPGFDFFQVEKKTFLGSHRVLFSLSVVILKNKRDSRTGCNLDDVMMMDNLDPCSSRRNIRLVFLFSFRSRTRVPTPL